MRYKTSHIVYSVLSLVLLAIIWLNSMKDAQASSDMSQTVLAKLIELFNLSMTEHTLRKLAHGCEYTLLGFLLSNAVWRGMYFYGKKLKSPFISSITPTLLSGVLIALADETIQIFSEGRSAQVTDVWIDAGGILAGIIISGLIALITRNRRENHSRKFTRYTKKN